VTQSWFRVFFLVVFWHSFHIPTLLLASSADVIRSGKSATVLVDLEELGSGSAFCIRADGYFITNAHVVSSHDVGEEVTLVMNPSTDEQKSVKAKIIKVDSEHDLALLKVDDAREYPVLNLGSDKDLVETQDVIVFGYPFGRFLSPDHEDAPSISVNTGKISALRRKDRELALIQIDANVNPGNSGGPVLDEDGKVIGVVVSAVLGAGVSFAIPVHVVKMFLSEPGIQLRVDEIPFLKRSESQTFHIEVFEYQEHKNPLALQVIKQNVGRKNDSYSATATDKGFSVTLQPFPPTDTPPLLEVYLLRDGVVYAGDVQDSTIRVGRRTFQLSEISRIEKRPDLSIVTTIYRTKYAGHVQGLPLVEDRETKQTITLERADEVQVYGKYGFESHVQLKIEAQRADKTIASLDWDLELDAFPKTVNLAAESELDGGLAWLWRQETPSRRLWKMAQAKLESKDKWKPLWLYRPDECLKLGPFSETIDDQTVLEFIARGDISADLEGNRMVPAKAEGELFVGPQENNTSMYYVFYIRSPKPQQSVTYFETYTESDHSQVEGYLDFRKLNSSKETVPLGTGNHIIIVKQKHDHSDQPDRSWIKFAIQGEELKTASFFSDRDTLPGEIVLPHKQDMEKANLSASEQTALSPKIPVEAPTTASLFRQFIISDMTDVVWDDIPANRPLDHALILGPLPELHSESDALCLLASFGDSTKEFLGRALVPSHPDELGRGRFPGPKNDRTCQYYLYLIHAEKEVPMSWQASTLTLKNLNSVDVYLDFEPVAAKAEISVTPGIHAIIVRQNHHYGIDGVDGSWASLNVAGDGIQVGYLPMGAK
tara:strand:- start:4240 stop:6720 length:2481 start_codon:yes stop_codon:yes gene_type:complete